MGDQSPRLLHRHQNLRSVNHRLSGSSMALSRTHRELSTSNDWYQHSARLHRFSDLLRIVLLFGLELPQLCNGGTKRSLQVIANSPFYFFACVSAVILVIQREKDQIDQIDICLF